VTASRRLLDWALAIAVFAATLALFAATADNGLEADWIPFAALASLPLAAYRRAPAAVFVACVLGSAGASALGAPSGPPLGPTLAVFLLARAGDGSREQTVRRLALVGGMLLVHLGGRWIGDGEVPWSDALWGVTVWGGIWLLGERSRLGRERLAELEQRALTAEREAERERRLAAAEERTRIAGDLHDSAGHAINVIMVQAGAARLNKDRDPEATRAALMAIEDVARETVGEIDQMVRALRADGDGGTEPIGLAAAEGLVERHRAAGLEVELSVDGESRPLAPAVDRAAYRILQEALTNAARHGGGDVRVTLDQRPDALDLTVENALRGTETGATAGGGHGLVGMRERAALLGGALEAGAEDAVYTLRARLPVERP